MAITKGSILCGLWIVSSAVSQDKPVKISFDALAEFSEKHSRIIQNIKEEFALTKTEKEIDLQWTNPTFNYSQEFVNEELDQYYTLNKQIEFPWVMSQRRKSWQSHLESAHYKMDALSRQFMYEVKYGYCKIKLLENQRQHLEILKEAIVNFSDVAESQFHEGNLSGIEQNLIQMSLLQITVNQQAIERKLQSVRNQWKINMGIDESSTIQLTSTIIFQPIEMASSEFYFSVLATTPGYLQREEKKNALEQRIKLEQKRLIPHFSVFGGSKHMGGNQGYIAGLSIPIPILNRNKANINRENTEHQIAVNKLGQVEDELRSNMKTVLFTIQNLEDLLKNMSEKMNNESTAVAGLISAYEEGWMSLTEMLNAIQIQRDGKQQYYEQLNLYYKNIFQLEEITGESLVTFLSQGENKL